MQRRLTILLSLVFLVQGIPHPSLVHRETSKSHDCYFDWDCIGGLCCSSWIPGCIGDCVPCGGLYQSTPKCLTDKDCIGGHCCSSDESGVEGVCVPCKKEIKKLSKDYTKVLIANDVKGACLSDEDCVNCCFEYLCAPCCIVKSSQPKCIYDYDCEGGFCCDALQPGLEGACVPCGRSSDASPALRCQYDSDCQGGHCCVQDIPGLEGYCYPCGKTVS